MIIQITDRFILHDIIHEALGFKPNDDQIDSVLVGLPNQLIQDSEVFGFRDMMVKQGITDFLTDNKENAMFILSKYFRVSLISG